MEKQHLTYFKIENFKRFDSFEMSNLGQFNLIVGDNNVGKTSVLESLLFDEDVAITSSSFLASFGYRSGFRFKEYPTTEEIKKSNFWSFIFRDPAKAISATASAQQEKIVTLELVNSHSLSEADKTVVEKNLLLQNVNTFIKQVISEPASQPQSELIGAFLEDVEAKLRIPDLVPANLAYDENLPALFYNFINPKKSLRRELEEGLRKFIPNLEEIRIHRYSDGQDTIGVTLLDSDSIYPLSQFGDGTVKLARLLLHIIISKEHRLMVDEIGAGIHFTRLTGYWKTIIQLCDKYKVQLFATTHSLECQQAFIEALEAPDMQQYQKDARNISLIENKEGVVEAITFDFEQFEYALNIGFNTRGGKR